MVLSVRHRSLRTPNPVDRACKMKGVKAQSVRLPMAPAIVALTSVAQLVRLRRALEPEFQVLHARTWDVAMSLGTTKKPCAFFICPTARGAFDLIGISELATLHRPQSIILYGRLKRAAMTSIVAARRLGIERLVLEGFEDSVHQLRLVAEDAAYEPVAHELSARLAGVCSKLDGTLADAVEQLVRFPRRFRVGEDLAHVARTSLRTLYRRFDEAGLATPRIVVIGARVVRAHWYMRELGMSPAQTARRLRYASATSLARQCQELAGLSPRELSLRLTSREVVSQIAAVLTAIAAAPALHDPVAAPRRRVL